MAKDFTINSRELEALFRRSPTAAAQGAKRGLDDIKRDWVQKAVDVAPIDPKAGGNLRRQIKGRRQGSDLNAKVIVTGNAANSANGSDFNYGYYIHEMDAGGKQLRTPGTVKKFLEEPAEENEAQWRRDLESEIESSLRRAGW